MFTRTRLTLVAVLVAIVALLAVVPITLGQGPAAANSVEVVGTISSVSGATITVNALSINVAGAQTSVALVVGTAVKVEGTLQPDGSILAREVKAAEVGSLLPGELEIIGRLTAIDAATAVLGEFSFDLTDAEVEAGLLAGDLVQVHARLGMDGVWEAREIRGFVPPPSNMPADHPVLPADAQCSQCHSDGRTAVPQAGLIFDDGGLEIVGTLDQIGAGFLVLGGQRYVTTGAELKGPLVPGMLVKVELLRQTDGTLAVHEAEPASLSDSHGSDDEDDDHDGDREDDAEDDEFRGDDSDHDSSDDHADDSAISSHDSDDSEDDHGGRSGDSDDGHGDDDHGDDDHGGDDGHDD